jgi:putative Mg2+ transporter-C (MgtC) family protein
MWQLDLMKLVVAALFGILLGLERELKRKPLGLKTCVVISVTSCLLTIVSIDSALMYNAGVPTLRADPTRITAQIVSGIGFLGAGVILRRSHEVVSGLTTAAMVWAASGLGIAVGSGFYVEALAGILLLMMSVEALPWLLRKWGPKVLREKEIEVSLIISNPYSIRDVLNQIQAFETRIERLRTQELPDRNIEVNLVCVIDYHDSVTQVFEQLERIEGILSVTVENL